MDPLTLFLASIVGAMVSETTRTRRGLEVSFRTSMKPPDCRKKISFAWVSPSGEVFTGFRAHRDFALSFLVEDPELMKEAKKYVLGFDGDYYESKEIADEAGEIGSQLLVERGWIEMHSFNTLSVTTKKVTPEAWAAALGLTVDCVLRKRLDPFEISVSIYDGGTWKGKPLHELVAREAPFLEERLYR